MVVWFTGHGRSHLTCSDEPGLDFSCFLSSLHFNLFAGKSTSLRASWIYAHFRRRFSIRCCLSRLRGPSTSPLVGSRRSFPPSTLPRKMLASCWIF
ncbi:hypothetical protein DUNSADRAFT_6100 [Dunaliella salina]|uniref:Encoded protein n=1 Tax=Dunaliella salina TaxID=3046 RepID=A0ABQ7H704_DUNSA|nr:hypothetical protein DUNSADRAFT_6100 [Dunaliella salina]|eukprot:KAF5842630.1 hypothetical protein DUNSADRAFT_6100 [Dunaliella salina]